MLRFSAMAMPTSPTMMIIIVDERRISIMGAIGGGVAVGAAGDDDVAANVRSAGD